MIDPVLNVDLLDKTLDHIETLHAYQTEGLDIEHRWGQGTWGMVRLDEQDRTCGTSCCFAGHAVQLAGHRLVPLTAFDRRFLTVEGHETDDPITRDPAIKRIARQELGLNEREGSVLFRGSNGINQLREAVGHIKEGRYR